MAKFIGKNLRVKVGSTELTTNIASVEVTETVDEIEVTALGQNARSRIAGLKDASVTLSFHQDYDASSVNATLSTIFGGTSSVTILAGTSLTQGTATSTAPLFTIPILCSQQTPVNGVVGDLTTFDVTWPATGEITKSTAGTF
jgi:ABC-type bacteriocin/lantibiotic exporter with double-glycine peptidase domain